MPRKKADAGVYTPPTRPYTLASGRAVEFVQPDMFDLASGKVELPNSAKLDIWHLLYRAGADDPKEQLLSDERYTRSLYRCAQLVIRPRVRIDDEDDVDAVIDRKELSMPDLLATYTFLRYGPPPLADDRESGASEEPALTSDGISSGTE